MPKLHLYRREDRGPTWQAQVYVGGKHYRFSCHTTDNGTARHYAHKRTKELEARHNRGLVGLSDPIRISQVLDRYEQVHSAAGGRLVSKFRRSLTIFRLDA